VSESDSFLSKIGHGHGLGLGVEKFSEEVTFSDALKEVRRHLWAFRYLKSSRENPNPKKFFQRESWSLWSISAAVWMA